MSALLKLGKKINRNKIAIMLKDNLRLNYIITKLIYNKHSVINTNVWTFRLNQV